MTQKRHTEEFKREAVQFALNNHLPRQAVADDLGIGKSTLNAWIKDHRDHHGSCSEDGVPINDLQVELLRLKRENKVLRDERDLLKKATAFFASQK